MKRPYSEIRSQNNLRRVFKPNVDNSELVWHRDKEDRIVESSGHTDWMVQLDNQLPIPLTETVLIPKEVYHRVIKGTGDLTVKIKKLND